jgi:hypothetical protein
MPARKRVLLPSRMVEGDASEVHSGVVDGITKAPRRDGMVGRFRGL